MDKWNIKSQSAMEFLILAAFLLFIFVVILGIVSYNSSFINKKKEIIVGEDIVIKVQKEVNLAAKSLDGYSREFYLPRKLGKGDYEIYVIGDEVIVERKNQNFWKEIPTVIGNVTKGTNVIRKVNETIYLN